MDIFAQIAEKIISEQEKIIGPIALEQARKVNGLSVDDEKDDIKITGDKKEVIDGLVEQYKHLFGQASVEVCKEASRKFLGDMSANNIPSSLQ
jgi:hypothetical protein